VAYVLDLAHGAGRGEELTHGAPAANRAGSSEWKADYGCAKRGGKRVALSWVPDWSWGLPLLILTIVAHVSAIVWTAKTLGAYRGSAARKASRFIIFVALAALASTVYLALEAAAWAVLYLWVGALPDWRSAMRIRSAR